MLTPHNTQKIVYGACKVIIHSCTPIPKVTLDTSFFSF